MLFLHSYTYVNSYSETSDKEPSVMGTTFFYNGHSSPRPLLIEFCLAIFDLQDMDNLATKCPLLRGSTVHYFTLTVLILELIICEHQSQCVPQLPIDTHL